MPNITVSYKGLTGTQGTIAIDNGESLDSLIADIAADEGITSTDYYSISLSRNYSINDVEQGDSSNTLNALGIVTGDEILCTPNQTGSKEERQRQKLDIAAAKRSDTYDITQLPTQYSGNAVVDNPNVGGLVLGRPWATSAVTALFVSLAAEAEIRVDDTTGISPGMIVTGTGFTSETVTVVAVNSSISLTLSIIAPDPVPAPGTVLTFTTP